MSHGSLPIETILIVKFRIEEIIAKVVSKWKKKKDRVLIG